MNCDVSLILREKHFLSFKYEILVEGSLDRMLEQDNN